MNNASVVRRQTKRAIKSVLQSPKSAFAQINCETLIFPAEMPTKLRYMRPVITLIVPRNSVPCLRWMLIKSEFLTHVML